MSAVSKTTLPNESLLKRYRERGHYTDCYCCEVAGSLSHADYVTAFYCTKLFKLERAILKWFVSKPSSDDHAHQLANDLRNDFAAWVVESRTENQLLMCDFRGRTRSWFMTDVREKRGRQISRLYFGSAVVMRNQNAESEKSAGLLFNSLLWFHRIYSRALLFSAATRLKNKVL